MGQILFRSDDSIKWPFGFGRYSYGARTISADNTESTIGSSFSGSEDAYTGTGSNASFAPGQFVLIIQSRGTGVGLPQYNMITAYNHGTSTITFALPLVHTYTDSGDSQAQIIVMKDYSTLTLDATKTWSPPDWDGNTGGILAAFADTININGIIDIRGKGYRGGASSLNNNVTGQTGEGTAGAAEGGQSTRNGNGGSGGPSFGSADHDGCGGGHGTAGSAGADGGEGGSTSGNAELTEITFGGAGGGDCASSNGDSGGDGGGILILIARNINIHASTGQILADAIVGGQTGSKWAGAGAGGAVLLKGMNIVLNTNRVTAPATYTGGAGRIHVDYATSLTGSTNPTLDYRQDTTLAPASSGAAAFF